MKIHSIQVREVGRFSEPVELTGLQPGINLLVGENEAGKSTLFKALNTVFTESYATKSKKLEASLRPYIGGAPRIEVEFESNGEHYRLSKQYFGKADAELVRLPGGHAVARGGEVDPALAALFDRAGDDANFAASMLTRLNLLWLDDTHDLAARKPVGDEASLIKSLVGQQAETVSASESARDIAHEIHAQLAVNLTPAAIQNNKITPKKNTPLHHAVETFRAAEQRVSELTAQIAQLAEHQQRYATLLEQRGGLGDEATLEANAKTAAAALAKATKDRGRQQTWQSELDVLNVKLEQAQARHAELENSGAQTAKLSGEKAAADKALGEAVTALEDIRAQVATSRETLDTLDAEMASARASLRAIDLAAKQKSADRIAMTTRELGQLETEIAQLEASLSNCALTEEAMIKLRDCDTKVTSLEATLDHAQTSVTVSYDDPKNPNVKLAGSVAEHGISVTLDGLTQVDVPGALMRIEPGGLGNRKEVNNALRNAQSARRDLLAKAGFETIEAAETAWSATKLNVQNLSLAQQKAAALAPDGRADLEQCHEALKAEIAHLAAREKDAGIAPVNKVESRCNPEATEASQLELEDTLTDRAARKAEEIDRHEDLQRQAEAANAAHATAAATLNQLVSQLEAAGAVSADVRAAKLKELTETIATLNSDTRTRSAALLALAEEIPDEAAVRALEAAAENAEKTLENGRLRRVELGNEIARLDGILEAESGRGLDEELASVEAELADARSSGERIRQSIEELFHLGDTLRAVEAERHAHLVAPLRSAMRPYLEILFEGSDIAFDDDYQITTIVRSGTTESIDHLSSGTREQIAIIGRLAYARLMADAGLPTPLILDDAMVFSDDTRIAQMFDVLIEASHHHQIIILTCRNAAFAALPAARVALTKKTPHTAAAE